MAGADRVEGLCGVCTEPTFTIDGSNSWLYAIGASSTVHTQGDKFERSCAPIFVFLNVVQERRRQSLWQGCSRYCSLLLRGRGGREDSGVGLGARNNESMVVTCN
jgi:hypothetical protein